MSSLKPEQQKKHRNLQLFRLLIAGGLSVFLCQISDLGTNTFYVLVASLLGVWLAGKSLSKGKTLPQIITLHAGLIGLASLIFWLADLGASSSNQMEFAAYRIYDNSVLLLIFYLVTFFSSYFFWTRQAFATWEALGLGLLVLWTLGGHRNYQLDSPKTVNELAWSWGYEPQHLLLALGLAFTLFFGLYLVLASTRPIFGRENPLESPGPRKKALLFGAPLLGFLLLTSYAYYVNKSYSQDLSRASNGVGQEAQENQTPLGFHSAVGKTKQPSALVRLEGDYTSNPWNPMLYLREGALSRFSGRELVVGDASYDTDTPRIGPGQSFVSLEDEKDHPFRTRVSQSIYLLTKHQTPFAVDFVQALRTIKNPDPDRFQLAYQAVSLAPMNNLEILIGEEVGNEDWDQKTWNYYTRAPGSLSGNLDKLPKPDSEEATLDQNGEDLRYAALAKALVSHIDSPVLKAATISAYLSKNSLYTRQPGHQATNRGDPVAPYLFSDEKRGYCVHFAHAAVYLMRLSGVPARIATGYLTDMTYAKDGHILLHLGDRHAWPEIYVRGQGWMVVDITPEQAENEQAIIPDEKLLEELMSKIDPAEEFIPPLPEEQKPEEGFTGDIIINTVFNKRVLLLVGVSLGFFWLALKLFLRFGYLLPFSVQKKTKLAYLSFLSTVFDHGLMRNPGETREEYSERLRKTLGIRGDKLTQLHGLLTYGPETRITREQDILASFEVFRKSMAEQNSWAKRLILFFSPRAVFSYSRW